jgi:hypothetical protein
MRKRWKWLIGTFSVLVVVGVVGGILLWDYHEKPSFCGATCHIIQPYVDSWESSIWLDHNHAKEDITCTECHKTTLVGSATELISYLKGDYKTPMRERKVSMEECFECHGTYEEMIPLTAPEVLGAERNPHDGHWGRLECSICHNMHRDSVDYCAGCHDPVTDAPGWVPPES